MGPMCVSYSAYSERAFIVRACVIGSAAIAAEVIELRFRGLHCVPTRAASVDQLEACVAAGGRVTANADADGSWTRGHQPPRRRVARD